MRFKLSKGLSRSGIDAIVRLRVRQEVKMKDWVHNTKLFYNLSVNQYTIGFFHLSRISCSSTNTKVVFVSSRSREVYRQAEENAIVIILMDMLKSNTAS